MSRYAVVKDGKVTNLIEWSGDEYDPGEGCELIELDENSPVAQGWAYENGEFSAPGLTEEQEKEIKERKTAENIATRSYLLSLATENISPLQDAVDLDEATEEEKALLLAWKKYRIAVNRIDANTADDIDWPEQPA